MDWAYIQLNQFINRYIFVIFFFVCLFLFQFHVPDLQNYVIILKPLITMIWLQFFLSPFLYENTGQHPIDINKKNGKQKNGEILIGMAWKHKLNDNIDPHTHTQINTTTRISGCEWCRQNTNSYNFIFFSHLFIFHHSTSCLGKLRFFPRTSQHWKWRVWDVIICIVYGWFHFAMFFVFYFCKLKCIVLIIFQLFRLRICCCSQFGQMKFLVKVCIVHI